MASWLKHAEDLFEVVDRRAKLVVSELSEEQSNDPPTASNGKVTQSRSIKARAARAKARAKAPKTTFADEQVEKEDRRLEESSLQPSASDSKPDETVISTLNNDGLTPETSKVHSNIEQQATTENSVELVATFSDNTLNEARNNDNDHMEATPSPNDEMVTSSSNNELNIKDASPVSNVPDIELDGGNNRTDTGQNSRLNDSDDSCAPIEEKSHSMIDNTPSVTSNDGKKAKAIDDTSEVISDNMEKEDGKANTDMSKVEEQLDEAQGLLKSTNSTGQSKEARLSRVCAGLSSRLQEYKSENAQLEELLTTERELSKSYEDQIKQLQHDLSAARKELNRSESNMAEALAAKNKEIKTLATSLDALKKQAALSEGNMASLQANMETLMRNRELTETRMMQALREELALAERRAEEERAAHSATKKAAMEREVELEHRAVEASTALARTQRMADERAVKAGELEQKVAMLEVECASLNQELQDMEARLRREQKKSPEDASQFIQAWQEEVERARQGQRDAESKFSSLDAELQKMRVEMAAMKRDGEHYSRQEHMELEKRYRELTDLLYYKQTQLETMASEKAAADFQLEKEMKRLKDAQAEAEKSKISRRTLSSTWDEEADMKELEPLPLHQRHLAGASIQLRKAAKFLDSGAVRATRVLWRYPRARVGLVLYLVFVHLFLMYLLHRLQAQTDEFAAQEVARSMGLSQPKLP